MPAGVELATAYVNLAYETGAISAGARRDLGQVERDATTSGKKVGQNLGAGIKGSISTAMKAAGGLLAAGGVASFFGVHCWGPRVQ